MIERIGPTRREYGLGEQIHKDNPKGKNGGKKETQGAYL